MVKGIVAGLATALLLNFAGAPFNQGYLALIAFVPLFLLFDASWRVRLATGWWAGLVTQVLGYYWIFYTIRDFGGQSEAISLGGAFLFWLYQALDLGLWLWLTPILSRELPPWAKPLCAAGIWTLLQTGLMPYVFPWQYGALFVSIPIIGSSAALWGSAGLGFLAVLCQAVAMLRKGPFSRGRIGVLALLVLLQACGAFWQHPPAERNWRVAVVQPNLIPWAKEGRLSVDELLQAHYQPSLSFRESQPDLVVWPETALPFFLADYPDVRDRLRALAVHLNAGLITGTIGRGEEGGYYNEIWLFDPDNDAVQIYRKERLVMFSETLPWIFRWARYFDQALGGFRSGRTNRPFQFRGKALVPLVCFEALFSDYVSQRSGHLLVNLTNDAWFGPTKASALHLQQIRMRSIETGAPLVRATNSGISCWVDPSGRVRGAGGIYQAHNFLFEIPLPQSPGKHLHRVGGAGVTILSWLVPLWGVLFLFKRVKSKQETTVRP